MMTDSDILMNEQVLRRFAALDGKNKLAHAYLFIGPPQIGKAQTALGIAKMINCANPPDAGYCDTCPSCVKFNTGNHPDLLVVEAVEGETIKIEQIRRTLDQCKLRPFLARKRMTLIKEAERMTADAANAFLKTLEEPSASDLIILTTSVPEKNLNTIVSRCHKVHFPPASADAFRKALQKDCRLDDASSRCLSYFAQGCVSTARRLNEDQFMEAKNVLIDGFILARPGEKEIKEIASDKEASKMLAEVLYSWIRDCMLIKSGVDDERIIHQDRLKDLKRFTARFPFADLNAISASVVKMRRLLSDNLNIKLPIMIIGEQLWEK